MPINQSKKKPSELNPTPFCSDQCCYYVTNFSKNSKITFVKLRLYSQYSKEKVDLKKLNKQQTINRYQYYKMYFLSALVNGLG